MRQFLEDKLNIVRDGTVHVNELIAMAIVVVAVLILILVAADAIKRRKNRENTIFSHRKNRYKSRIGKKNKY